MNTQLKVPQGIFELQRQPFRKHEQLRAWDAADEYLLNYLAEELTLTLTYKVLILNDSFGALSVALNAFSPMAISDSYLSQLATQKNLEANNFSQNTVQLNNVLDWPVEKVDLVLIKAPKTLALLEYQLIRLQPLLTCTTKVIAAGMVKAMSAAVWKLIQQNLGETKPSLARKKARLIFVSLSLQKTTENPYPVYYQLENTDYRICNHANVFSRDSLDIGTRFLLQNLPQKIKADKIVDLGCGNGVVGLILAQNNPVAKLYFVDESYMAIASAKENFQSAFENRQANFCIADGLAEFESQSMDLIVCNPPFHQQHVQGNQIAISMFKQAYRVLRKQGALWVIGNRHLAYHIDLQRIFGDVQVMASNEKFIIWRVEK